MIEIDVWTEDGVQLWAEVREGTTEHVVLLLPAMMVDHRSLDRPAGRGLATTLHNYGHSVVRADFRGHGRSQGEAGSGFGWDYSDLVRRDVPALVQRCREQFPGRRVWVLGHSLGGHVAAASWAAGHVRLSGLVLLGANAWLPSAEPSRRFRWLKRGLLGSFLAVSKLMGRWPSVALGAGPVDESLAYVEQMTGFFWADHFGDAQGHWHQGTLDGRILCITSRRDWLLGRTEGVLGWLDRFRSPYTSWVLWDGDLGLDRAPDHMGLGADPASRPLWVEIARWIDDGQA